MPTNTLETQSSLCTRFIADIHNPDAYVPFPKPDSHGAKLCASYALMFGLQLNGPTEYTVGILSPGAAPDPCVLFPFSHRPLTEDERDIRTPLLHDTVIQDARRRCSYINRTLYYPFITVPVTKGVLSWLIADPPPESPAENALLSLSEQLPDTAFVYKHPLDAETTLCTMIAGGIKKVKDYLFTPQNRLTPRGGR